MWDCSTPSHVLRTVVQIGFVSLMIGYDLRELMWGSLGMWGESLQNEAIMTYCQRHDDIYELDPRGWNNDPAAGCNSSVVEFITTWSICMGHCLELAGPVRQVQWQLAVPSNIPRNKSSGVLSFMHVPDVRLPTTSFVTQGTCSSSADDNPGCRKSRSSGLH